MRFGLGQHADAVERRIAALMEARVPERIWQRDDSLWGDDPGVRASVAKRLDWLLLPAVMTDHVAAIEAFAEEVRATGYDDVVLLGMGGSSLAPEVLRQCFERRAGFPALHVLDTTDPVTILGVTSRIDPSRTLFIISSKSGTTIEVSSLFAYFYALVEAHDPEAGRHFVAITDAGTPLERLAADRGFRRVFHSPTGVGGRYSALSYFGLVPAAVSGIDVSRLLDRARVAAKALHADPSGALRLGAALGELAKVRRDKCTFLLSPGIAFLGLWLEQLIAESTGKQGVGIVPVVNEPLGTPLKYGGDRVFVEIRMGGGYAAETDALTGAMEAGEHPVIIIDLEDAYDLGAQFFQWEFAVAIAGCVLGINPFDEPNVAESKENTSLVLQELKATGRLGGADVATRGAPIVFRAPDSPRDAPFEREVAGLIGQIRPGDYFAIIAYIPQTQDTDAVFSEIRRQVRDRLGVATTLGYGPRYLHSTGQLHKGGPPEGVFLQVTADDEEDVDVSGQPYTFGELKRAQAIGDLASLHGRLCPVLRVHLGSGKTAGLGRLSDAVLGAIGAAATARR